MNTMYSRYEKLLKEFNVTNYRVAKETGNATATLSDWKNGKSTPKTGNLKLIADYFDVSLDYLIGKSDFRNQDEAAKGLSKTQHAELNARDKRDIARRLKYMLEQLDARENLMFDGETLDEETRELIKISIENSLKIGKALAKQKYTPKKYRKNNAI